MKLLDSIIVAEPSCYDEGYQNTIIMASAIRFKEKIYIGMRHHHCFKQIYQIYSIDEVNEVEQGFVTNFCEFIDRKKATEIALVSGQIKNKKIGSPLFSEELW